MAAAAGRAREIDIIGHGRRRRSNREGRKRKEEGRKGAVSVSLLLDGRTEE